VRARQSVIALALMIALYLALVGPRASLLISSGEPLGRLIGLAVLVAPLGGVVYVWREARLARAADRLAAELGMSDDVPFDDDRSALLLAARRLEVESAPHDWAAWYRLGRAHEARGEHREWRGALRHAVALRARAGARR
jgi:cytochrome c-type biogenesis protein CcmH/NrfG